MTGSNTLSKITNWLGKLFNTISSPLNGFDVSDVKVKQDGDEFSEVYTFTSSDQNLKTGNSLTNLNGEPLELYVLIQTVGAKDTLTPLLSGINELGNPDFDDRDVLLNILLGNDNYPGLLNIDIGGDTQLVYTTEPYAGTKDWSWGGIALKMRYAMECQAPGKDPGMIESQTLQYCGKLIGEYLRLVKLVDNSAEVSVDSYEHLIYPILGQMQAYLKEYYDKAKSTYGFDENYDTSVNQTADTTDTSDATDTDNFTQGEPNMDNVSPNSAYQDDADLGAFASKHIDVTLQKIAGTTSFNMTAIKANYNPTLVLEDMDEIISQSDFIDTLPEEPTSYSIDVDDDGFDIEPCDECIKCDPCDTLSEVFKSGIRAYRNLYIIHWMSAGNDMMKLHLMTEEMYEELQGEIDTIGELLVEKQGTVPQLDFPCDYIPVQKYDFQTGLAQIKSLISMYIDCIDYAYCNQDSDVQSTLDEWLRYWKKQMRYFVERQEI